VNENPPGGMDDMWLCNIWSLYSCVINNHGGLVM